MFPSPPRPARRSPASLAHLWWFNPCWPLSLMLLSTGLSAYIIPNSDFVENWKAPKCFNAESLQYIALCVAGFVLASAFVQFLFGSSRPAPDAQIIANPRIPWPVLWFLFYLSAGLTTMAYVVWLLASFAGGLTLADIMAVVHNTPGAIYVIRDKTETIPGVTTFTQLEMAACLLGTVLGFRFGWKKNLLRLVLPMVVIFVLAFLRAHFREERLAILEIIIPVSILSLALARTTEWPMRWRVALAILPLVAPLALYVFFSAAEYSRSWVNFYQQNGQSSFFWFTFARLAGYYVTALNNGAGYVQDVGPHGFFTVPFYSFEWFWKFPGLKEIFPYPALAGFDPDVRYTDLLTNKLNPELNNPSGVFILEIDYGFAGGILAWGVFGAISGFLYRLFLRGSLSGLLLYPFFYVGLLESPLILYWVESRSLATWVLLFFISLLSLLAAQGDWRKPREMRLTTPATRRWRAFTYARYPSRRGL